MTTTPLNMFLLNMNFDTILIFSMFAKFSEDQKSITMSSIKCLNFKFLYFKIMHIK